jgi:hypothetical protein
MPKNQNNEEYDEKKIRIAKNRIKRKKEFASQEINPYKIK